MAHPLMVPFLVAALLSFLPTAAPAAQRDGVEMPDTLAVAGKELKLNGLGTRKATFLKVKVYVAGLYLEAKNPDPGQILQAPGVKHLVMKFVHEAPRGKMADAWEESREKNCGQECEALKPAFDKLKGYMTDMKEGDSMTFTFLPEKVEVEVKGEKKPALEGASFSRTLLLTWLGPQPPNSELKEGLLGK